MDTFNKLADLIENGYSVPDALREVAKLEVGSYGYEKSGTNINGTTYDVGLRINDLGNDNPAELVIHKHSTTLPAVIVGSRSNSNTASHADVGSNTPCFTLLGAGWCGNYYGMLGRIDFRTNGTIGATSSPGSIRFRCTPASSNNPSNAGEFDGDTTSGNTRFLVYDIDAGSLVRVSVGAANSGGAGYKLLRVPN